MFSLSKKIHLLILVTFIIQSNIIEAQKVEFIDCRLINSVDKTPIPFATIILKNKSKGLASNMDGGFRIPYELYKSKDTLVISSIGYSSKEIPISSLDKNVMNVINLVEKTELLNEVRIIASKKKKRKNQKKKRKNAREIINLALKKIPENYPFKPFSYIGYYRDYQIKEKKYLNLNEALMEVFDSGFGVYDLKETQTRIYQYKKNFTFPTDTIASRPYNYMNKSKIITNAVIDNRGGNEYTILRIHDAIRNYNVNSYDFVNRLDLNFVKNHKFKLLPDTFINNTPLYSIEIYKNINNISVRGKIYISKVDFKIYKMQYAVYDKEKSVKRKKKLQVNSNVSQTKGKNLGKLLSEIILEYQLYNEIMYPNYISFNNPFEILLPPEFFVTNGKIYNATNALELTFNNIPLPESTMKKKNYSLLYKGIKLKTDIIKDIKVKNNKALLYLDKKKILKSKPMQSENRFLLKHFTIKVYNIKDVYGNVINEQKYASYNQFREFFVQELKTKPKTPSDSLNMLKNKPIFKNQPIVPFSNLSDYWMNTPLKN